MEKRKMCVFISIEATDDYSESCRRAQVKTTHTTKTLTPTDTKFLKLHDFHMSSQNNQSDSICQTNTTTKQTA